MTILDWLAEAAYCVGETSIAERKRMSDNLEDLNARRALCLMCIQVVSETPIDDPRREGAIAEYNRQLAFIDGRIAAITGKPPDIVIRLKPAILFPKSERTSC